MTAADPRAQLLDLAAERGVSLSQLSLMIGRNISYLQQFVRKRSPQRLAERDRAALARFFGVDQAALGAGDDGAAPGGGRRLRQWVDIPRLPLGASAGQGALAGEEQAVGAFGFSAAWLRRQNLDPAALSAIAVIGDSMEPTLRHGDEILVDRSVAVRSPRPGIHVVRLDDDSLLVKRLAFDKAGLIALISDNPVYPPIERAAHTVHIIGRVVWKGGRL